MFHMLANGRLDTCPPKLYIAYTHFLKLASTFIRAKAQSANYVPYSHDQVTWIPPEPVSLDGRLVSHYEIKLSEVDGNIERTIFNDEIPSNASTFM